MTRLAVGFGRAFPKSWLLPIGALTVVLGIAASGWLSRSIVADFIAWWPVWLGIAVVAYLFRERKFGMFRAAGLAPLVALVVVGLFTWGHLSGWTVMPSASHRLVGPEADGFASADMNVHVDGVIEVEGGGQFLYLVEPVMRGGRIGIPVAAEQVIADSISIELEPPADPGLYSFAGWDLELSSTSRWTLTLEGAVDADLSSLDVDQLTLAGSGAVVLGQADEATGVSVDGMFHIVVPEGEEARVIGLASVPASWSLDGLGAISPTHGEGWVITVAPEAVVTVSERSEPG